MIPENSARWLQAIPGRHSRRNFLTDEVPADRARTLQAMCEDFRPFPDVRAVWLEAPADAVFAGAVGHYGQVKGSRACIAFVARSGAPLERIGFLGEALILEATSLGLGTCWVTGLFDPEKAGRLAGTTSGERVVGVTPVGFPAPNEKWDTRLLKIMARSHKRKPLPDLILKPGLHSRLTPWALDALEAARLAPSAVNRQPWRFDLLESGILLEHEGVEEGSYSKRLDCGIALLHLEIALRASGHFATIEPRSGRAVALVRTSASPLG